MGKIRIGAVSYVNTKPLVFGLRSCSDYELSFDLPSQLAEKLRQGEIDVGLIPIVEYLRGVGEALIPGVCIASDGPVRTVKLFSRVHPKDLTTVAVDSGSRTSVALLRILLLERFGVTPDFHTFRADLGQMLKIHEAALLIGDSAFTDSGAPFVWDLGEGWKESTGQPFVYATWVVGKNVDVDRVRSWLETAVSAGLSNLEQIAAEAAAVCEQDTHSLLSYLRDSLHYTLGAREVRGIEAFQKRCHQFNILGSIRPLNIATSRTRRSVAVEPTHE